MFNAKYDDFVASVKEFYSAAYSDGEKKFKAIFARKRKTI